jgi:hypothetical protein
VCYVFINVTLEHVVTISDWCTCFQDARRKNKKKKKVTLEVSVCGSIASNVARFGHVGGKLLLRYYDLYRRLQFQFYVLLTMGAMDTRNM